MSICLSMIVRNEAPVIRRALDSVRPIVDFFVIVDTGSTDDTQAMIESYLADLPGELYEQPWVNFAHNRTEALELARGHGDYTLILDADDVLTLDPGFVMPHLSADSYNVLIEDKDLSYHRTALVRSALPWRYIGVLHEVITCEQAQTSAFLSGLRIERLHDGARARDPLTYRKDALLLEAALLEEPLNARYVFYLAQSYRDAGDFELAIRRYRQRVYMGGWAEERWFARYEIARLQERMLAPWPEVMQQYLTAYEFMPDRAEPLYRIAMHYQGAGQYSIAALFLERAIKAPAPTSERLFVERAIYDYLAVLEYAVALHYLGRYSEAIAANDSLLERAGLLPPHIKTLVERNRRFSVDAMTTS